MLAYILLNYDILPNLKQNVSREMNTIYNLTPDNFCLFKKRNVKQEWRKIIKTNEKWVYFFLWCKFALFLLNK